MQEWTEQELNTAIQWKRTFCLYLYTPMCGTCQVASRMLSVSLELLPDVTCGKMNMNFSKKLAMQYEIESVPCLMIFKEGKLNRKIYAFQSVPYLYEVLKDLA
ncbi:thioredoxin [Peribacillus cavernae]|uniref:Thioredoxin n=1 Tax=Peribacillus cavernae TaxID=1674310 RepID=A0A3S0TRR1_9BACI|nr:thioredoxin family protein [Peribacillus cavernae]MDQ0219681.1 thioredoxin-like negative regulator of GroEL [Peribacillus cavernae]RUQ25961.1 thioredoxin [Peribacillus cavernae]